MNTCSTDSTMTTASGVSIEWNYNPEAEPVDRALVVLTEVATGNQTRYEVAPNIHTCLPLIAGMYRVAIFAKGLERYRGMLELRPGATTSFKPILNPSVQTAKTFKDVLGKFDLNQAYKTRDLEVAKNTTMILDVRDHQFKADWKHVEIKDVQTAKRLIGHSDEIWGGSFPRFTQPGFSLQASPEVLAGQVAREYVYGNSATVKQWTKQINDTIFSEISIYPIFIFGVVTVNAGATLVIGDQANFFVCKRLRMHVTATLLIRGSGPIYVEPLAFEDFC